MASPPPSRPAPIASSSTPSLMHARTARGSRGCRSPHSRRPPVRRRGGDQHRHQIARQHEEAGDIDAHHAIEAFPRKACERLAPTHPGIVDENVQFRSSAAHFVRERRDACLARDRAAKALARADRGEFGCDLLAGLGLARRDQHPCPRAEQRLRTNPPEPGRSAGDERGAALHGKEIGEFEHRRFLGDRVSEQRIAGEREAESLLPLCGRRIRA